MRVQSWESPLNISLIDGPQSGSSNLYYAHQIVSRICVSSAACGLGRQTQRHTHKRTLTGGGSISPPELKQLNEELSSAVWLILLREEHQRLTVSKEINKKP